MIVLISCSIALAAPFLARPSSALPPGYTLETMITGFYMPVGIRFAPDGRLFTIEVNTGRVYVTSEPPMFSGIWASIPPGATGLRGMAFHPMFPDTPYVYFVHGHEGRNRIVRLREQNQMGTELAVIRDSIPAGGEHSGGRIAFGPDGMLYLSTGEMNFPSTAQDPADLRGKILRFTALGGIPPDNPLGPQSPVYALGIRNCFGLCFDPVSGRGYFTDNGPSCDDELDLLERGANYGWDHADPCGGERPGAHPALALMSPSSGITGCVVFRGNAYPGCNGDLFFGHYRLGMSGAIRRARMRPGSEGTVVDSVEYFMEPSNLAVLDVVQGPEGWLWFSTTDAIYRIRPSELLSVDRPGEARTAVRVAPNPFSGSTSIHLSPANASRQVEVLDLTGRRIRRWVAGSELRWDGRDERGRPLDAGVYLVRVLGSGRAVTVRVVHLPAD